MRIKNAIVTTCALAFSSVLAMGCDLGDLLDDLDPTDSGDSGDPGDPGGEPGDPWDEPGEPGDEPVEPGGDCYVEVDTCYFEAELSCIEDPMGCGDAFVACNELEQACVGMPVEPVDPVDPDPCFDLVDSCYMDAADSCGNDPEVCITAFEACDELLFACEPAPPHDCDPPGPGAACDEAAVLCLTEAEIFSAGDAELFAELAALCDEELVICGSGEPLPPGPCDAAFGDCIDDACNEDPDAAMCEEALFSCQTDYEVCLGG